MARSVYKPFFILLIFLLGCSLISCKEKEVDISMDKNTFNNQNASSQDNQALSSGEMLSEGTNNALPGANDIPTIIPEMEDAEEDILESFQAVEETVYATSNVKIRSNYSTQDDNVIAILKLGESISRIGLGREWSKVIHNNDTGYIMSAYLTTAQPKPSPTPTPTPTTTPTPKPTTTPTATPTPLPSIANEDTPKATVAPTPTSAPVDSSEDGEKETVSGDYSFVEALALSDDIEKLVCVIGSGDSECIVSYHKKDQNGQWVQVFRADGDCGSQGITYQKREGDNKTPAGLYSFTLAFGLQSDPGAHLNYRRISEDDYWIDDINSPYYNTWVNASDTPGDYTSEHLIDHNPSYNYALNINYNADCTPGLGSAIFLHCFNGTGYTSGCIAVSEKYMKTLVKEVDSGTRILIIPEESDLSNY